MLASSKSARRRWPSGLGLQHRPDRLVPGSAGPTGTIVGKTSCVGWLSGSGGWAYPGTWRHALIYHDERAQRLQDGAHAGRSANLKRTARNDISAGFNGLTERPMGRELAVGPRCFESDSRNS